MNSAQDGHRKPPSDKGQVSATFSKVKQRLQPNICTVALSNSPTVFSDKPKHPLASSSRPFLAASFSLQQMLYRLHSLVGEDLHCLSLKWGTGDKRTSLPTRAENCYHYLCGILNKNSKKAKDNIHHCKTYA